MKKIVFADFDGVLTSTREVPGSYLNGSLTYGISPSCFKRLVQLCNDEDAVVIMSSNWRRFDDDGIWSKCYLDGIHVFSNPLPKLKAALGSLYAGDLPKDRHISKSAALVKWLEETKFDGKFVVFDDDPREGFQDTEAYGIKDKFIRTDVEYGLTDEDVLKAKMVFKREAGT